MVRRACPEHVEGLTTNDIKHLPFVLSYSKSNLVSFYSINLKLKNGAEYPLFSPGWFFEGDRSGP